MLQGASVVRSAELSDPSSTRSATPARVGAACNQPKAEVLMSNKLIIAVGLALVGVAGIVIAQQTYPNAGAPGVLMENDHVVVQRLDTQPGAWVGAHHHEGNQLVVILDDSTMTYKVGDEETEVTYQKGDVFWIDAVDHDHMAQTAGGAIIVTVK
jgi:quercetin dioxygenase-like cupin family protein